MTSFDRVGLDRVHAHLATNTGRPERAWSPDQTRAFTELAARARDARAFPVFEAPPELPDEPT